MKIQLINWKVLELNFSVIEDVSRLENSYDLNIGQFYPEDEPNNFSVRFKIKINDKEFDFKCESIFNFSLDDNISEEFKISDFPKINAPAIAFPYLRAFISNFTLQSGFDPIILPSINFIKLDKESK
jgi:preprotein translocase subunit SecB